MEKEHEENVQMITWNNQEDKKEGNNREKAKAKEGWQC